MWAKNGQRFVFIASEKNHQQIESITRNNVCFTQMGHKILLLCLYPAGGKDYTNEIIVHSKIENICLDH